MVHQELNQVLRRSVMENVWLGRFPMHGPLVDGKRMYNETKKVFESLNIDVDPKRIIGDLSVSQRQMVEIAKAVSYNAKIVVLDEPTSSLTENEVEHLFKIIEQLTSRGVGIIYISHKMDEILRISDDVTIMRDGQWVATRPAKELNTEEIIRLMVNRDMSQRFPEKNNHPGPVLMEVKHLTGKYEPTCHDVSFELRKGEVLGRGRPGRLPPHGAFEHHLRLLHPRLGRSHRQRQARGKQGARRGHAQRLCAAHRRAPRHRHHPLMNINFNSTIANLRHYGKLLLSSGKMGKDTKWVIDSMRVKTPSQKTHIRSLSGGNQQKVIIGRWLLTEPDILLLDEPTRGIDVGAKFEIYQLILQLAEEGKGVIMVSSEMPELIGICDRILVMSNGRMAGIVERGKDFGGVQGEQETILTLAAKYV